MLSDTVQRIAELLVLWQEPTTRAMVPIGVLSFDGDVYTFEYLPAAQKQEGFRPLLGFRDLDRKYVSESLFPLFEERVLDPTRPDFGRVIDELALDESEATPWELLVRTGGTSEGDTLQVTPFPHRTDTGWAVVFLAAGLRYFQTKSVTTADGATKKYGELEYEQVLDGLRPGDQLRVVREIDNHYNPDAQLLFTEHGDVVGYLPDWLARFTAPCLEEGIELMARVAHVNGPRAGWHLRLMVGASAPEPFEHAEERLRDGDVLKY